LQLERINKHATGSLLSVAMVAGKSTIRCVGAVVHDNDGRLLLIRRAQEPAAGQWSIPGGRVEPGESDAAAVVRELHEETGLDVVCGPLAGTVIRGEFEIHDYWCTLGGGSLHAGSDAAEARWLTAAEYAELELHGLLVPRLTATLRSWNALPRA
jgi:8-oxo-dGTP diphosphatase